MDFSQTRLKLRVAVCPFIAPFGPEYHHRIVGMKRDSGSSACLVILRQFLLLIPLECTFADLTSRVISHYEKLYKNQPAYVPIKNIALFRDSNQCDLDLDYLVSDICGSNDLIYVMADIEESNKKIKIVAEEIKQQVEPISKNNSNQGKVQNEKKVPEFKPTPVKTPAVKQSPAKNEVKSVETTKYVKPDDKKVTVTNNIEVKVKAHDSKIEAMAFETKTQDFKEAEPKGVVVKSSEPKVAVSIEALETKTSETKNAPVKVSETIFQAVPLSGTKIPTPITKPSAPVPVPVKVSVAKKNQKQEEVKKEKEVVSETLKMSIVHKPDTKTLSEPVATVVITEPAAVMSIVNETEVKTSAAEPARTLSDVSVASYSEAVNNGEKRVNDMITPVPTPVSRPIFHPRKSEIPPISSSSDEEEVESVMGTFDTTNLFGPQVITSEPRRSDAFVLFAAGSSEDSSDENEVMIPDVPLKSSSIVSFQAAPSSELCEEESEGESESESDETMSSESQLPHSVTLRRLSSVSPIPDPSEIPSLHELKESINRAPTPIQIIQGKQQQKQQQQQQQQHSFKRGRPSKKHNNMGRPKKDQ
jgi:hypothetical protein